MYELELGVLNIVKAPVGSGKTTWAKEICTTAFASVVQCIVSHIDASVHIAVDNANSILIDEKTTEYLSNEIAKQIQKNLKDIVLTF